MPVLAQGLLQRPTLPPGVVLLEMLPAAVEAAGYEGGALALLGRMHAWGYTDMSHSGCAARPTCMHACCNQARWTHRMLGVPSTQG